MFILDNRSYLLNNFASTYPESITGNLYYDDGTYVWKKCDLLAVVASLVYRATYRCEFSDEATYPTIDLDEAAFIASLSNETAIGYPGYPGRQEYSNIQPPYSNYCVESSQSSSNSPSASMSPSVSSSATMSPSISSSITPSTSVALAPVVSPYVAPIVQGVVQTDAAEAAKIVWVVMVTFVSGFVIGVFAISYASR